MGEPRLLTACGLTFFSVWGGRVPLPLLRRLIAPGPWFFLCRLFVLPACVL